MIEEREELTIYQDIIALHHESVWRNSRMTWSFQITWATLSRTFGVRRTARSHAALLLRAEKKDKKINPDERLSVSMMIPDNSP